MNLSTEAIIWMVATIILCVRLTWLVLRDDNVIPFGWVYIILVLISFIITIREICNSPLTV